MKSATLTTKTEHGLTLPDLLRRPAGEPRGEEPEGAAPPPTQVPEIPEDGLGRDLEAEPDDAGAPDTLSPEDLGWPPGFFERTAGCWEGEPLEREDQGSFELRDPLE